MTGRVKSIKAESLLPQDIIIAVMGPTGSGKSRFIGIATNDAYSNVGHTLESFTSKVHAVPYVRPKQKDGRFILVDTPGFDDTHKSDTEILSMIADWLRTTYKNKIHLAGIIYMHRISDNRMAGSPLKNLRMFGKLCGDEALPNVILATTMWDRVDPSTAVRREDELKRDFWKRMLALGSPVVRFHGTFESAWQIIDLVANKSRVDALLLQEELVNLKRQLSETQAGMVLYNELQKLLADHKETLRRLRDEAASNNDKKLKAELDAEYEVIQQKLQSTFNQISSLKLSFTRRIALMFGKKSRITSNVLTGF